MLKKLVILGLLSLGTILTWPQIVGDGSQKTKPAEQVDGKGRSMAQPSIGTVEIQSTATNQTENSKQKPSDYPWGELLAPANIPNWCLVGVGFFAGWMALKTLATIRRQVDTFISKERGRLTVEIGPFDMQAENVLWKVDIRVINHGSTKAFIGRSVCSPCVANSEWKTADAPILLQMDLPKVVPPNEEGATFTAPIFQGGKLGFDSKKAINDIRSGTMSLYVLGRIDYEDVFGGKWQLRFCRKWQSLMYAGGTVLRHHGWTCHGGAEENYERQTKEPSKLSSFLARIRKFVSPRPKDSTPKTI